MSAGVPAEARERAAKLRDQINDYRYHYHVLDESTMSEAAADSLKHELSQLEEQYPELITPTRELLALSGLPYVIENVPRARKWMRSPITLCGATFGLDLYRHRLFESNVHLWQPEHRPHAIPASKAGHWKPGTIMSVSGHVAPIAEAKRAMGIDWMTRDELAESIPPAYTQYIGEQLLAHVSSEVA